MSICVQFLLFVAVYLAPRVHKTRKYPHGEPKIEFTTLQTTVVYKHNILNTISPFIFYNLCGGLCGGSAAKATSLSSSDMFG